MLTEILTLRIGVSLFEGTSRGHGTRWIQAVRPFPRCSLKTVVWKAYGLKEHIAALVNDVYSSGFFVTDSPRCL